MTSLPPDAITAVEAEQALVTVWHYDRIVLAVSGGADSTALMHLFADVARGRSIPLSRVTVVTIDHNLRQGSAAEAAEVSTAAAALGLAHETRTYDGPVPAVPFAQSWARDLRYRLLTKAARDGLRPGEIAAVLTAHHQDDQAETVIMRLARGSGVDGLAGIPPVRPLADAIDLVRPLLAFSKARLHASLTARGVTWIDDPSNTNQRFERVRLRARAPAREKLGLTSPAMALSAQRAARASRALAVMTERFLSSAAVEVDGLGFVRLNWDSLLAEPEDIRLRALATIIASVSGRAPVSLGDLEAFTIANGWASPAGKTFGYCAFRGDHGTLEIVREAGRGQPAPIPLTRGEDMFWDGRFQVRASSNVPEGAELRWLTAEGRAAALAAGGATPRAPSAAVLTFPSLWQGMRLIAAPFLGIGVDLLAVTPFRLRPVR
jgi:tRNA(Ile)-lysidine synthase